MNLSPKCPSLMVVPHRANGSPDTAMVGYFRDMAAAGLYADLLVMEHGYASATTSGTGWNGEFEDDEIPTPPLTVITGGAA